MRFLVLGPVEARMDDDRPVALPGGRPRALLAALLLDVGRICAAHELIDAIWGDAPPQTASTQLHIVASRLRTALQRAGCPAEHNLVTRRPGYLLRAAHCDLSEFRAMAAQAAAEASTGRWQAAWTRYRTALELWRGPALQDVTAPGIRPAALGLDAERMAVRERGLAAALLAGTHDDVLVEASRLLVAEPLRERLHYLLMAAHALSGRAADALAGYRAARIALATELGVEPGPELAELEHCVLRGDRAPMIRALRGWAANGSAAGTGTGLPAMIEGPAAWPRPWEVPADIPDLVGRSAELTRVGRALTRTGATRDVPATVSISGLGGVGKTALAVRAARRYRAEFPDGCLFASMGGGQDTPRAAHEVLGSLLRSLGIPGASVPDDREARLGLYRSVLSGRRVLVVVDDAVDERQVRPLLPASAGSAALVTSRRSLSGLDGVTPVVLDVLRPADAAELLTRLVDRRWRGDERASVPTLVELCGRLPLALRVVGARLAHRHDLSVGRLAHRLADERSRLSELSAGDRDVRACLFASYRRLAPPVARLLRLAATLPSPQFPLWLAAALADSPVHEAERSVDDLVEAQLLQTRGLDLDGSPRYVMHDLVRLFAAERAVVEDGEHAVPAAVWRGYTGLLRLATDTDARLPSRMFPTTAHPPVPSLTACATGDPLAWFEQERVLLTAAVAHTSALGWWDLAWRLAVSVTNAADLGGFAKEWDVTIGAVRAALNGRPAGVVDPRALPSLLLSHGLLLRAHGRNDEALPVLLAARRGFRHLGDGHRAAVGASAAGSAARSQGRPRLARHLLTWALEQFDAMGVADQQGWAHLGMANLLLEHDTDRDAALRSYARALRTLREAGDRRGEANALGCIGALLIRDDRPGDAAHHLAAAIDTFAEIGDVVNRAVAESLLARALTRVGQAPRADGLARRAEETLAGVNHEAGVAQARIVRAEVLLGRGETAQAVRVLKAVVEAFRRLGVSTGLAYGLYQLAKAQRADGDGAAARTSAREAVALYRAQGDALAETVRDWLRGLD